MPNQWYAVRTKLHKEDRAASNLIAWGIEVFAPMLNYYGRSATTAQPLFPGYVFARFDATSELRKVNHTRGIAYVVSFGGVPTVVGDEIVELIRRRLSGSPTVDDRGRQLKPGQTVTVNAGPFQGLKGIFERGRSGSDRVRIMLETIAYPVHVELRQYQLQPNDRS